MVVTPEQYAANVAKREARDLEVAEAEAIAKQQQPLFPQEEYDGDEETNPDWLAQAAGWNKKPVLGFELQQALDQSEKWDDDPEPGELFARTSRTDPNWCCVPNQDRPGVHASSCNRQGPGTRLLL